MGDTKTCTKCRIEKPVGEFYKDKSRTDGYSSNCKVCKDASNRRFYENNRKNRLLYKKRHYAENRKEIREKQREYFLKRYEGMTAVEKAARASISLAYKRSDLNGSTGLFGAASYPEAIAFTIPLVEERLRLEALTGEPHQIHHKKSLSLGGLHVPENLCVITARENVAMGNAWFQSDDDLTDEDIERLDQEALEFTP